MRALFPFSGAATSTIMGRPDRLDALGASFVNAISANLLDFDDTHMDTIIHPAAPVAAPVLALAEARGSSGRDVIKARDGTPDVINCGPGKDVAYVDRVEDGVFDCERVLVPTSAQKGGHRR